MKRPVALVILAALAGPFAVGCCLCRSNTSPEKYAVLASTRMTYVEDVEMNSDFWHDLVLTYCTLKKMDFENENIFVLYGDGQDFSSTFDAYTAPFCDGTVPHKITDISITNPSGADKASLCNVLCCMSTGHPAKMESGVCACKTFGEEGIGSFTCTAHDIPRLGKKDFLITWVRGHGNATNCKAKITFASGPIITDEEMEGLLKRLKSKRRVLFFENCDAGGWLDNFQGDEDTVVVSSGDKHGPDDCSEVSHTATYDEINPSTGATDVILHGRFSYWVSAALRQADLMEVGVASDTDLNNLVSIQEGFDAARANISAENSLSTAEYGGDMFPAISTPEGIAPCIFIRLPFPGNDHDAFSMDHDDDDGTVPSVDDSVVPFESPDVWLSDPATGGLIESPVAAGTEYRVNARVYNIGCADPGPVEVEFFTAVRNGNGCETIWTSIGTDDIQHLPVGETLEVSATWQPNAGDYCLIAQLSASPRDKPNDATVAYDNNKAQVKVEVVAAGPF